MTCFFHDLPDYTILGHATHSAMFHPKCDFHASCRPRALSLYSILLLTHRSAAYDSEISNHCTPFRSSPSNPNWSVSSTRRIFWNLSPCQRIGFYTLQQSSPTTTYRGLRHCIRFRLRDRTMTAFHRCSKPLMQFPLLSHLLNQVYKTLLFSEVTISSLSADSRWSPRNWMCLRSFDHPLNMGPSRLKDPSNDEHIHRRSINLQFIVQRPAGEPTHSCLLASAPKNSNPNESIVELETLTTPYPLSCDPSATSNRKAIVSSPCCYLDSRTQIFISDPRSAPCGTRIC